MRARAYPRWALSLADLTMLLLTFSIMLHIATVRDGRIVPKSEATARAVGARAPLFEAVAAPLFEAGEARLTPHARARLMEVGHKAAERDLTVRVESSGAAEGAARFDRWELGAARAAAVARALAEGGLPAQRIDVAIDPLPRGKGIAAQQLVIRKL